MVSTRVLEAATKAWIGGSSGWSNPAAWSPAGVPDAADEIQVDGGSIQLDVAVTISNRLTWNGGTIRSGSLRIAAGAAAELNGAGDKAMQNLSLVNEGTLRVNQGRLALLFTGSSQYATLTNQVGGLIEIVDTAQVALANPSGYTPAALALVNEGVLRKTGAGAGAVAMVPLANRGRVEVVAGLLQWTGGGVSPGTFQVPEGSAMDLRTGTYDLAGSRWEGLGAVRIRNTTTVRGVFHAENFGITGGTINGDFDVDGAFEWTGGSLVGARVRLGAGQHQIAGSDAKELQNASLSNAGQLLVSGSSVGLRFSGSGQSASITNETDGTITLAGDAAIEQRNPLNYTPVHLVLVNAGTLRSSGIATNRVQDIPLNNSGVVEVAEGRLVHRGGGDSAGRWAVAAGAVSEWQSGRYRLTEATLDGPGPTLLNGTFTLEGSASVEEFEFKSGTMSGVCELRRGFRWTGGSLVACSLRLGAGTHRIVGDGGQALQNTAVVNAGRLVAEGAMVGLVFNGSSQSAVITNEASGVIELRAGSRVRQVNPLNYAPRDLALVNQGRIVSAAEGTNWVESIPLHNQGTIEIPEGMLRQTGGGVSPGQVQIASGASFQISGGIYDLNGSRWTGAGPARIVASSRLLGVFEAENFGLAGGDVDGAFDLSGGFTWTAGRLIGVVARLGAGDHRIVGDGGQTLQNAALVNAGRLLAEGAVMGLWFNGSSQSAVITNEASGEIELRADSRIGQVNPLNYTPRDLALVNQGRIVSATEGTNWVESIPLHNQGTIEILEGMLRQTGGGVSPGEVGIASGAAFHVSGGVYDLDGGHWTGPGAGRIVASSRLLGVFEAENFGLAGGDLAGTFDVSGGFEWTGGWLVNAQARLGPGTHHIRGGGDLVMNRSTLANAGHLQITDTRLALYFNGSSQVSVLTNEVGGILECVGGAGVEQRNPLGYSPASIGLINEGTVRASGAGPKSITAVPLHNLGLVQVLEGTLSHTGGGTSPGRFEVGAAGRFEFSAGTYQFEGSRWLGPGAAAIVGTATVQGLFAAENLRLEQGDLSGTCEISGGFQWTGGNLVNAQVRLGPGEHRVSGPDTKALNRSTLSNAGHLLFEDATVGLLFNGSSQTAVVTNEAGGQLDLVGGARIEQRNPLGYTPLRIGVFNDGTLRKVGGGTAVLAGVPLVSRASSELLDGVLRVEGNATFDAGGKLTVGLGSEPGLHVTGTATLGGVLEVATAPGFEATAGATFTPLSAGVISGRFVNDVALNPGHIFQYSAAYSAKLLTLTAEGGLMQPVELIGPRLAGGVVELDIVGRAGLQYLIESSTNLVTWQLDFTTNGPADMLILVDPRAPLVPSRYYRVGVLP